ncbi:hypothetical protein DL768_010977 [Monosporascus sp. mg162]|nr:hypothetical protein DL768_010977 [Monosporascus sp. mg162]
MPPSLSPLIDESPRFVIELDSAFRMDDNVEISIIAQGCKDVFEKCVANPVVGQQPWLRSAHGDFNLWCAATKAISTSKSSLSHCLRHKKDARAAICGLIRGLADSVKTCYDAIAEAKASDVGPGEELSDERPESPLSWAVISGGSDSLSEDSIEDPLVAEHVSYIKTILGQLSRLAVAIRKSGNKYRFEKIDASLDESAFKDFRKHLTVIILRAFEDPDAQDLPALERMNRASDWTKLGKVQQHLVQANIIRRNRIEAMTRSRNSRARLARATQQPDPLMKSVEIEVTPPQIATAQAVQQQPEPTITVSHSAPKASSVAGRSQTVTAAATITDAGSDLDDRFRSILARKTLSAVTKMTRIGASQAYPRCPRRGPDGSLICPYCDDFLPAEYAEPKYRESWRAHVVQDLVPYSCIVENCGPPDEMYLTAEKLLAHMLEKHSVQRWTCDYCAYPAGAKAERSTPTPRQFFQTAEDWTKHVATTHGDFIAPQERSILVDMNKRRLIEPLSCPLCGFVSDSLTAVIDDHILSHLHEFALQALPDAVDDSLDEIESRITQVHSVLSHTQSADNATDELQYPTISVKDISQAMHDLKLLKPHQADWVIAAPPDSDEAATEVWQAKAGRLHAMIRIRNDMDPQQWLNVFNEEINGLHSTLRYIAPPYCPGNGSWERFAGPKTTFIPPVTANFSDRNYIMNQLQQIIVSGAESGQQARITLSGPSGIAKRSTASGLAHRLQKEDQFSIFWVDASTVESIYRSLVKIADSFAGTISTNGNASMRRRHLLHYLTWSFSGSWLMVLDGLSPSTAHDLAFEGLLPQAPSGSLLFIASEPRCATLLRPVKVIEVFPHDLSIFIVPYPRNTNFVGRSDILDILKNQLDHQQPQRSGKRHLRAALCGLGGIGKTQIALAYVYWLQEAYTNVSVFWVHGSNVERFQESYASIAQECQVPGYDDPEVDVLPLVEKWLERKDRGRWLMVIDNADDTQLFSGQEGLEQHIPECTHGSVLVTTRNKQVGLRLTKGRQPLEVRRINEVESKELLEKKLEVDGIEPGDSSTLSSRLGYIPLALAQAAAFMQETSVSVGEYLKLLDKTDQNLVELLSEEFDTVGRDSEARAVAKSWILSFEQIQRQNSFAGELLSLMSFLDWQAIPEEFLSFYSEQQQEPKGELLLTKAVSVLKAFSFVTESRDHSLDMHRLVQLVTRKWLINKDMMRHFASQALLVVSHCYPFGQYENWARRRTRIKAGGRRLKS